MGKIEGKKEEQGRELEPVEVINASMRAIFRDMLSNETGCQHSGTGHPREPSERAQREGCSVGRKDDPHC